MARGGGEGKEEEGHLSQEELPRNPRQEIRVKKYTGPYNTRNAPHSSSHSNRLHKSFVRNSNCAERGTERETEERKISTWILWVHTFATVRCTDQILVHVKMQIFAIINYLVLSFLFSIETTILAAPTTEKYFSDSLKAGWTIQHIFDVCVEETRNVLSFVIVSGCCHREPIDRRFSSQGFLTY